MIPEAAVEAGLAAWSDRKAVWPRDVVRRILEAAAPYMRQAFFLEMNLRAVEQELKTPFR